MYIRRKSQTSISSILVRKKGNQLFFCVRFTLSSYKAGFNVPLILVCECRIYTHLSSSLFSMLFMLKTLIIKKVVYTNPLLLHLHLIFLGQKLPFERRYITEKRELNLINTDLCNRIHE